jgi:hypothetical protein
MFGWKLLASFNIALMACPSVTESRFFRMISLYFNQMEIYKAEIFTKYVNLIPLH